jgi:hypothetical protein
MSLQILRTVVLLILNSRATSGAVGLGCFQALTSAICSAVSICRLDFLLPVRCVRPERIARTAASETPNLFAMPRNVSDWVLGLRAAMVAICAGVSFLFGACRRVFSLCVSHSRLDSALLRGLPSLWWTTVAPSRRGSSACAISRWTASSMPWYPRVADLVGRSLWLPTIRTRPSSLASKTGFQVGIL